MILFIQNKETLHSVALHYFLLDLLQVVSQNLPFLNKSNKYILTHGVCFTQSAPMALPENVHAWNEEHVCAWLVSVNPDVSH